MRVKDKLKSKLESESINDEYWYAVKQEWDIKTICFAISILKQYQNSKQNINFEEYFKIERDTHRPDLKKANHRRISNGEYLYLVSHANNYSSKIPTHIFDQIYERCNGEFDNLDSYYDIFESQVEKMYFDFKYAKQKSNNKFTVHPLFILYKILLLVGNITGEYKISYMEFKVFVVFLDNYFEVYNCVYSIIISRAKYTDYVKKVNSKINNLRFYKIYKDLKTLNINDKEKFIEINPEKVELVKYKIEQYENLVVNKVNIENMDAALKSKENIFDYYKGV